MEIRMHSVKDLNRIDSPALIMSHASNALHLSPYSAILSFPAGVVRASNIFPILSAILLLMGGVCIAASRFYKSKRNIVLGAGILFVAAGKVCAWCVYRHWSRTKCQITSNIYLYTTVIFTCGVLKS